MKINGVPTSLKFEKVICPECKRFCAMKFTDGLQTGDIECASSDHINPCNFYFKNRSDKKNVADGKD
jgi:hypothetical protein